MIHPQENEIFYIEACLKSLKTVYTNHSET